ncbi:LysR substrate-binding domain-containing protein, partial [Burkholderia gladioli]|nr:LysR substrate-binding domain-containing protein [Burkholderia gladioli]
EARGEVRGTLRIDMPLSYGKQVVMPVLRQLHARHPALTIDAVVEWFKGSALRPFLARLDEREQAAFLARYREAIADAYRIYEDGTVLLPFPRLFIVATR